MIHLDETCYSFLVSQKVIAIPDSTECCWELHRYFKELTGAEAPDAVCRVCWQDLSNVIASGISLKPKERCQLGEL